MKHFVSATLSALLCGCAAVEPASWVKFDARQFSFYAPCDLRSVPVQGIDSFVGHYTNQTIRLSFDYGWYSDALTTHYHRHPNYRTERTKVDGREAIIVVFSAPSGHHALHYSTGIHFPDLGDGRTKLTVFARCANTNLWPVLGKVFRSIKFRKPDVEQSDAREPPPRVSAWTRRVLRTLDSLPTLVSAAVGDPGRSATKI